MSNIVPANTHVDFAPLADTNQSACAPDGVQEPPLPEKDYAALVRALCRPDGESEWVEFKRNFANPKDIGQYIAALANSAALNEQPYGQTGKPSLPLSWLSYRRRGSRCHRTSRG